MSTHTPHIDLDEGDNTLYMFDENGEVLILAEGRDYATGPLRHIVKCVKERNELVVALAKAAASLLAERDCFYESIVGFDGEITSGDEAETLAEMDKELDELRAVLAKTQS